MAPKPITPLLISLARQYGLDPAAVIAVARGEGGLVDRPGVADIGDLAGGGSYGPFQLYARGALPAQYRGNRERADDWAWSPQGLRYALGRMASVGAKGLRGSQAVNTIIRKFERPADPDKSVRLALGRLGTSGVAGGVESGPVVGDLVHRIPPPRSASGGLGEWASPERRAGRSRKSILLEALLNDNLLGAIPQLRAVGSAAAVPNSTALGMTSPQPTAQPLMPGGANAKPYGIEELIYKNQGLQWNGRGFAPFAATGHDTHTHAAFRDPNSALRAIALAQKLGLAVRENPYTDPVDPVHTKKSWHYQTFPGLYNGRRLGRAIDVSGNQNALANYFRQLRR